MVVFFVCVGVLNYCEDDCYCDEGVKYFGFLDFDCIQVVVVDWFVECVLCWVGYNGGCCGGVGGLVGVNCFDVGDVYGGQWY